MNVFLCVCACVHVRVRERERLTQTRTEGGGTSLGSVAVWRDGSGCSQDSLSLSSVLLKTFLLGYFSGFLSYFPADVLWSPSCSCAPPLQTYPSISELSIISRRDFYMWVHGAPGRADLLTGWKNAGWYGWKVKHHLIISITLIR